MGTRGNGAKSDAGNRRELKTVKIRRLVLGTKNPGKIEEWSRIFREVWPQIEVRGVEELADINETGTTFAENACLKANYYAILAGEYAMSEDGGYEVDALGGAPGVKSRRILPGDKVRLEMTPYDKTKGRIVYRYK